METRFEEDILDCLLRIESLLEKLLQKELTESGEGSE